ncbi:MAG TPA: hypothetical protein VIO35_10735, partial [Chloroflexota bacterium]
MTEIKEPAERLRSDQPDRTEPAQPADLVWDAMIPGQKIGSGSVRIARLVRTGDREFTQQASGHLVATELVFEPKGTIGHALERMRRTFIGARIPNELEIRERVSTVKGLAVFASDNVSSSAYATEEIMRVLVLAGAGVLALTMPITIAIVIVLAVVVASYQQTIHAYPNGGG